MKQSALLAVYLVIALAISACAARTVDEELLPTPVPTLDPQALSQAAEAARPTEAPTATPVPPTPEPEVAGGEETEAATLAPEADAATEVEATTEAEAEPATVIEYGGTTTAAEEGAAINEDTPDMEAASGTGEDGSETASDESATAADETDVSAESPGVAGDSADTSESAALPSEEITATAPLTATAPITDAVPAGDAPAGGDEGAGATLEEGAPSEAAGDVDPRFAGMPEDMIAAMANADPANGEMLTLSVGCTGCHSTDPNMFMAGPTWYDLSEVAPTRVEGQSPGLYLYTSITNPNAFLVGEYLPNIMIQTYAETLPEGQIADIIAYLLTIRGR